MGLAVAVAVGATEAAAGEFFFEDDVDFAQALLGSARQVMAQLMKRTEAFISDSPWLLNCVEILA